MPRLSNAPVNGRTSPYPVILAGTVRSGARCTTSSPMSSARSAVEMHQRLRRAHLFERKKPLLAPVAASLDPAEWQFHAAASAVAVDEHLAAANGFRNALLPAAVLAPHGGEQAVVGTVRQCDRVGLVLERERTQHRTEHLVLRQLALARHVAEEHRLDVVAAARK